MYNIKGILQKYDWGEEREKSLISRFLDSQEPLAELWFGNHPKGKSEGIPSDWEYPFLLKILSIKKPLSVQVHPEKSMAEKLHKYFPNKYPDPNSKPEMIVALTEMEILVGFKPFEDILFDLGNIFEERDIKSMWNRAIRTKFPSSLVTNPTLEYLYKHHPEDPGIFAYFFLNHVKLSPGEGVYIPPGYLHTYLKGQGIECMLNSDNVIRAGMTSKVKDLEMLDTATIYFNRDVEILRGPDYICPFFQLRNVKIEKKGLLFFEGLVIMICLNGSGNINNKPIKSGEALTWRGDIRLEVDSVEPLDLWLACEQ